jgi:hypothetical protein
LPLFARSYSLEYFKSILQKSARYSCFLIFKAIVDIFDSLISEKTKSLVLFCCAGFHCHLDNKNSKTFFQVVRGNPLEDKVVVWLRLGRDERFVSNLEPPSNDQAHWRVVEELRY